MTEQGPNDLNVVPEFTNSTTKLNSPSRPFQAQQPKFNATFYQSHMDLFTSFNNYIQYPLLARNRQT